MCLRSRWKSWGRWCRIDLRVPPPGKPTATKETGAEILSRAQQAAGGAAKLAAVKDCMLTAEFRLAPALGGLLVKERNRWIGPEYFRQDSEAPTGKISVYFNGKEGWITTPQGAGPLAGAQLSQVQGDLFRLYFRLLLSDRIPGRKVVEAGSGAIYITSAGGDTARASFDSATGLLQKITYQAVHTAGAPIDVEEVFSDFRVVDGIKMPFKVAISQGAQPFADVTVTEVKLNSGLKLPELEQKPVPAAPK